MTEEEKRPEWKFEMPEDDARWFISHHVNKISTNYVMISADDSRNYVTFHSGQSGMQRDSSYVYRFRNWFHIIADGHRVIELCEPYYSQMKEKIEEIDKWERKNKRDRSEYERLKRKFG